jgi:hypothetical protein
VRIISEALLKPLLIRPSAIALPRFPPPIMAIFFPISVDFYKDTITVKAGSNKILIQGFIYELLRLAFSHFFAIG